MKIKIILAALFTMFFYSCVSPSYLPTSDKIDVNEYGAYIQVIRKANSTIKGELISIDSNQICVLNNSSNKCIILPITSVESFSLRYALPKDYGWTIPVFTLATISHGLIAIFSAPLNLIVTIIVTSSGENAFKYSDRSMTYDQLKMFARFPQGIPPNIEILEIK